MKEDTRNAKVKTEEDSQNKNPGKEADKKKKAPKSFMAHLRDWADALVIAYILAMFIRTYIVELFKIPTGSMTPTLVGDVCAEFDYDNNGEDDLVLYKAPNLIHVFYKDNGKYVRDEIIRYPPQHKIVGREFKNRSDMIMVHKNAYMFKKPKRGDIVVFKVPPQIYSAEKPVYIKRLIGLPGDEVEIQGGNVFINGEKLEGEAYDNIHYMNRCNNKFFSNVIVPEDHYLVLGDNSKSSLDSRYWGFVPKDNLRGRALLRYFPLKKISFLK